MTPDTLKLALDTVWTILAGCLVFWMSAGFAMIEAGFARSRHVVHVLAMNFAVVAIVALGYWAIGFGVMFADGNAILGTTGFFPSLLDGDAAFSALAWTSVPLAAKFFFQLVFADTTATIVSGTVAERMKFSAYMLFSVFMATIIYPIAGHWAWGGGFLSKLAVPFQDFAGSTVVHSIGGWAALTGTLFLGARLGRFNHDGSANPMKAHNLSIATLGAMILYLGWFGFNAGSTMAADGRAIAHICATTMLGGAAGMMTALICSWALKRVTDLGVILNGTLAGLVAITAGCNAVSMIGSVLIGSIAGILCYFAGPMFEKLKVDDPVGALPVHLVNGIWGTLAVGLFATKAGSVGSFDGLFSGGGTALLMSQLLGVLCVGAFVATSSTVFWSVTRLVLGGLRVSATEELDGMDATEHGVFAYDVDHSFLSGQQISSAATMIVERSVRKEVTGVM